CVMTPAPLHATRGASRAVRTVLAGCAAIALAGAAVVAGAVTAAAATACRATFVVNSQWPGGFSGAVSVVNLGPAVTSWTLEFDFPGTQRITQSWNGAYSQEGRRVTIRNEAWNGSLGTNQTVTPGFNGSWSSGDQPPT